MELVGYRSLNYKFNKNKMDSELLKVIQDSIAIGIKENVNGKIDRLNLKLDHYIDQDNAWKKTAQPVIDMGINARGASKVLLYLTGAIVSVGMAWEIICKIFKK
jgi:hypothetical protein